MPSLSHRPFYHDMFHDAWMSAWRMRLVWLVAIGAGILQTGGIIDVLCRLIRERVSLISSIGSAPEHSFLASCRDLILGAGNFFNSTIVTLKLSQVFLLGALFGISVLSLAILCQGALVYIVGVRGRFTRPTFAEAFQIAGEKFWRVAVLNLLPVGAYLFAWFVFLAPFGTIIQLTSAPAVITYVLAVMASLVVGFVATSIQMLALQSVVLDETHVEPAIKEAYAVLKRSWLTIVETALALFAISIALFIATGIIFLIFLLPFLALVGVAIVFQAPTIADILILFSEALFVAMMLSVGGFTIVFQYTVWNRLSTRLGKNMAVAGLIRIVHHTLNRFKK